MANQADIANVLQRSGVSVYGLQVSESGGKTKVSGTVYSEDERDKARQAITNVVSDAEVSIQVGGGTADTSPAAEQKTYTVKSGDNLRKIAKHLYGDEMRWKELYEANKATIGNNPDRIQPGMELTVS